jgi:flagellar hook-associated protein 1 FlgK
MALPNIFQTGRSGMVASKAAMATTGHNIANANTEGYSRQRIQTEASTPTQQGKHLIGGGTLISRAERINDEHIEKQLRNGARDLASCEEKDVMLKQAEDIFNEMNGDGLNRLIAKFYNEFRRLSNEPDNEAVRQSVREGAQAMVNDFHRLRQEVEEVRRHVDARLEGYSREINANAEEIKDLNIKIKVLEAAGGSANDLLDKRDLALKRLASYMDLNMHKDGDGAYTVDVRGVGPLVSGPLVLPFSVERSPADDQGKPENALDLKTAGSAKGNVTHQVKGGKVGALLEIRDKTLSTILDRLDELAYTVSTAVNDIHAQGFTRSGLQGVCFFKQPAGVERAAEFLDLSDEVKGNVNNIAAAAQPDSPGDNRIAIAISTLQGAKLMNGGHATMDDFYNSIVSDVGVASAKNKFAMNQQHDIMTQLGKMRDQISGVSIDEETANLMQFQQAFGASAKVIQVADECLKTVLDLKR